MSEPRTLVTFKSEAFNTTEQKPEFINPDNFGDDLARWLVERLSEAGFEAGPEIGQEDFGWYLSFRAAGLPYCLVVGHREEPEGARAMEWLGWVEREAGLLGSLFGARNRGIQPEGPRAIHQVLNGADCIREVRWHYRKEFEAGAETGSPEP